MERLTEVEIAGYRADLIMVFGKLTEIEERLAFSASDANRLAALLEKDSWTGEMQQALDAIPIEFVGNDLWVNGIKRLAAERDRLAEEVAELKNVFESNRKCNDDMEKAMLAAEAERDRLAAENERLQREKAARVYYQDIVYKVCIALDKIEHRNLRHGQGIVCGTLETPTTEVQEAMERTKQAIDDLAAAANKAKAERDRLAAELREKHWAPERLAHLRSDVGRLRGIIGKLLHEIEDGWPHNAAVITDAKKELEREQTNQT